MNSIIQDINSSLKAIIDELEQKQHTSDESLAVVQSKIDEKINEAKKYKFDVDNAKQKIKELESDINALKIDLDDLNNRFGNKDLSAVVDAGNREINGKILEKQNEITRNHDRINELTDRARTIKDLLINLKKDKEAKKAKADYLTKALTYYKKAITNITNYATSHPDALDAYELSYDVRSTVKKKKKEEINITNDINNSVDDTSTPIFDEIEVLTGEKTPEEINTAITEKVSKPEIQPSTTTEPKDDRINIFDNNNSKVDLKTLNDNIDKEYADIFGESDSIKIPEQEEVTPQVLPKNIFNQNDLQEEREELTPTLSSISALDEVKPMLEDVSSSLGDVSTINVDPLVAPPSDNISEPKKVIFGEEEKQETGSEMDAQLVNFFTPLGIDYYSFKLSSQDYLKRVFNPLNFSKIIEILKDYKIALESIYTSPNIFGESTPDELEQVIKKLLECGQTTENVGYVLNTLPLINSFDLAEVIESYGPLIKDANITDLIIKAKHLNDIGGAR